MTSINSALRGLALAGLLATSLSACVTSGPFNGMAANYEAKIYPVSDPDRPPPTEADLAGFNRLAGYCDSTARQALASNAETIGTTGGSYSAAGAVAGGSQSLFYAGVDGGAAAGYGATYGAMSGGINGAMSQSYAITNATQSCTNSLMEGRRRTMTDPVTRQPVFDNLYPVGAYVRVRDPQAGLANRSAEPAAPEGRRP